MEQFQEKEAEVQNLILLLESEKNTNFSLRNELELANEKTLQTLELEMQKQQLEREKGFQIKEQKLMNEFQEKQSKLITLRLLTQ